MKEQTSLLEKFRSKDKWLLIVLDACRYDTFDNTVSCNNSVYKCWSRACNSQQWRDKEWGSHEDVDYITPNPHFISNSDNMKENIIDCDDTVAINARKLSDEFGGTKSYTKHYINYHHPVYLVHKMVNECKQNKMVAHFMQPHQPFPEPVISSYTKNGELNIRAYTNNLIMVINHGVSMLLDKYKNFSIAITADHGELLGEDGRWEHGLPDHDILHCVPWVEWSESESVNVDIKTSLDEI